MKPKTTASASDLARVLASLDSDEMQALAAWSNLKGLKKFLQSRRLKGEWATFARVVLGSHTRDELLQEPILQDSAIHHMIKDRMFTIAPAGTVVEVVALTAADLGLKGLPPGYDQILDRGQARGLKLCPPEVGLQFWLQGPPLAYGDWFGVAMTLVPGHQQFASYLAICRNNKFYPDRTDRCVIPRQKFGVHYRFIFCR